MSLSPMSDIINMRHLILKIEIDGDLDGSVVVVSRVMRSRTGGLDDVFKLVEFFL